MRKNHGNNECKKTSRLGKLWAAMVGVLIAALIGVTCGVCFVDAEKPVSIDGAGGESVETSANQSNLTGNQLINAINNGQFSNNNYIDYSYNGSYYSINLPIGTYKLELWGAEGGSFTANQHYGGKGSYVYGNISFTSQTTIYIYIGSKGSDANGYIDSGGDSIRHSGGYNGGGYGTGYGGAGGGGATDIRLGGTSTSNRIMVASGGGAGRSGYNFGTQYYGTSGRRSYTLYYGENGCTSRHSSRYPNDDGGGGGGYYGGACYHGDDYGSGYAGSNYADTTRISSTNANRNPASNAANNGGGTFNNNLGNGKARITAVSINKPPTSKNASFTASNKSIPVRGVTGSALINASDIASDPEGTAVYFTDGNSANYDTVTTSANAGLYYMNGSTLTNASKYFSWTWNSTSQIKITNCNLYPRSGVDGSPSNGTMRLYARVRDTFSGGSTQRGTALVSFDVTVPVNTIKERSASAGGTVNASSGNNRMFVGRSNTSTAPTLTASPSTIYNPLGTNRYTAIFESPLRIDEPVTINAADLVLGDCANNSIRSGDRFVVALNSTTAISGSGKKYEIVEYTGGTYKQTVYNASRVAIANAFSQLSFKCLKPDPTYQVFTVTVYQIENNTAYGNNTNTVPNVAAKTVDIVFKMDNTRPTLKKNATTAPVVTLNPMSAAKSVSLSEFYSDDDGSISTSTHQIKEVVVPSREFVQVDKYGNVVSTVNTAGEHAQKSYFNVRTTDATSTMMSDVITTGMLNGSGSAFSTGFENWFITSGASDTAFVQYSFSGVTLNLTGLRATYDMYSPARRSGGKVITSGSGSSLTYADGNPVLNAGHFYILIKVQDKNDTSDTGIWLPLGIVVNNARPSDLSHERGGAGAANMPTAEGSVGNEFFFTPMGITVDQTTTPIGWYLHDGVYDSVNLRPLGSDSDNYFTSNMLNGTGVSAGGTGTLNELLKITSSAQDIRRSVDNNTNGEYFDAEYIPIYIPTAYFGKRLKLENYTDRATISYSGAEYECVVINGLKITLRGWTHNRYLQASVDLVDSTNNATNASATVKIAIKVDNVAPNFAESADVAQLSYSYNGKNVSSSYNKDARTVTYNIPVSASIMITPYDILKDADMSATYPLRGFTLNGLNGLYNEQDGVFSVDAVRTGDSDRRTTVTGIATSANAAYNYSSSTYKSSLFDTIRAFQTKRSFSYCLSSTNGFGAGVSGSTNVDRLYFERRTDSSNLDGFSFNPYGADRNSFVQPSVVGSSFISHAFGSKVEYGGSSYDLDFILITATGRTQSSAPVKISLNVRDRMGEGTVNGVQTINIVINVVNSSPRVQFPEKYYSLTTDPIRENASHTITDASAALSVIPSTLIINATTSHGVNESNNSFLIDDEDVNVSYYYQNGVYVVDQDGNSQDAYGKSYITYYLRASITAQTLTLTALNSTQAVKTLYVVFAVTDGRFDSAGNIEYSPCRIRVEVVNADIKPNKEENGFASVTSNNTVIVDNLWNVETLNEQDITKARYFTSGARADAQLTAMGVTSVQMKRVVVDTDGLQGVALTPASTPTQIDSQRGYVYAAGTTAADYRRAVPTLGSSFANSFDINGVNGGSAAVVLNSMSYEASGKVYAPVPATDLDLTGCDIIYFVDSTAYTATELITGVMTDGKPDPFASAETAAKFFDSQGRWIVTDWAVVITPKKQTSADSYISLRMSLRDETRFGGGTAGKVTGWKESASVSVDMCKMYEYCLFVNSIGIVPYTYYNQFDGYYTVADGVAEADGTTVNYISTYDGTEQSVYRSAMSTLYLATDSTGGKTVTTTATATELKSRGSGATDGTFAGTHSGVPFDRTSDDYKAGYEYEVYELFGSSTELSDRKEKAFRYSDTITVAGEGVTYVPMSYFGLRKSLVNVGTDGTITYPDNLYVGYDVEGSYERDKGFQTAVTISDGKNSWSGINNAQGSNLADNPYVNIASYDVRLNNTAQYQASLDSPYFNRALAIATYADNGKLNNTAANVNFASDIVGNGHIMYLDGQEELLQENLFGLSFSKKFTRANASTLTITIKIAECQDSTTSSGTVVNYDSSNKDQNTATLTFKLEIANSPVNLVSSNSDSVGAVEDNQSGYYTALDLNVNDPAARVTLSRTAGVVGADRTILYRDNDTDTTSGTINPEKSDRAKFYMDSLRRLGSWSSQSAAAHAKEHSVSDSGVVTFANTSSDSHAQASMRNYYNASFGMNNANDSYSPNGGIYGTYNEGYSSYFGVEISEDGSSLYITPRAKTTINPAMVTGSADSFYRTRGLKYVNGTRAYYPLKVLVYDDHGDGFEAGSYVSLEIRVYISGAAPTLSSSLENHYTGSTADGKQINVALPVGQNYTLNIKDVLNTGTLITDSASGNVFWQQDYLDLKNSNPSTSDSFRLETGTYLMSPFTGWVATTNNDLIAGNAGFSSNQSQGYDVDVSTQNDVVMYMAYRFEGTSALGALTANAIPDGNAIYFAVNRRTTTSVNGVSTPVSRFTFKLRFTDNYSNRTDYLYINIEVTNQAPTIRSDAVSAASAFTSMRVGDSFTVVTTPYDRFIGAEDKSTNPSRSYLASTTYQKVNNSSAVLNRNLLPSGNVSASTVRFQTLTTDNLTNARYRLHNYDPTNVNKQHLGYIAVADDDTPWGLRIVNVTYYDQTCFNPTAEHDRISSEGSSSSDTYALDVIITAHRVCRNMPITITVEDADGARSTFTMYVTVESSMPSPIADGDREHERHSALLSTGVNGVYETYMISSSVTQTSTSVRISDGTTKTAYGSVTLPINMIAYDPDVEDNRIISLYNGGGNSTAYNVFTFNGITMEHDGTSYSNDWFTIEIAPDFMSFTLTCLTYNPDNDWDVLGFYVRDCGNDVFGKAIPIEIRICTLYSSVTNSGQTSGNNVTNTGLIGSRAISTVYVKAFDDYNGTSENLPENDEQLAEIVGVNSTYQFLPYADSPESIDQSGSTARGLEDPDVVNNTVNLNYELRVYALLNLSGEAGSDYMPLTLNEMSALFDLTPTNVSRHYWYLKNDDATVNQVSQYLVGGFYSDGSSLTGINSALSMFLQKYFVFDIGLDGVSLTFRPVTANLDISIPMYVQITKNVSRRDIGLFDVSPTSGTVFYVQVEDSAPIANDGDDNVEVRSFTGRIGDSYVFKIHDKEDPNGSLFTDSDAEDTVTVSGFMSGTVSADYEAAFAEATELGIEWRRSGGKPQAIEIAINNEDEARNGLPAHSLKVTINRRIDFEDEDGNYLSEVSVPINIVGRDRTVGGRGGKTDTVKLYITVCNSDFDFNTDKITAPTVDIKNGYYALSVDANNDKSYIIDAYVVPNKQIATFNFLSGGYIADPDYTSMATDTDSYRLVDGSIGNTQRYLKYGEVLTVRSEEKSVDVARVTPIFGSQTMPDDENHFAGFGIEALSYDRSITDAVAYMRIIDRSGNAEEVEAGITVTLRIHILNAPPTVMDGKDVTGHVLIGSETSSGTPIDIDISDYVTDLNGDIVRIVGVAPVINEALDDGEIDPDIHSTISGENDGEIVEMLISSDLQKVTVTPRKGFYGKQSLYVMVADGDLSSGDNVSIVQFRHDFTIVYDIASMGDLNRIEAIRSLPTKITPDKLFRSVTDYYGVGDKVDDEQAPEQGGAETSANEARLFNPGADYIISELRAEGTGITINKDGDGDYQFVCNREATDILFHVTFKYSNPANAESAARTFSRTFYANVGKNTAPTLLSTFKDSGEDGYLFQTGGGELGLDNNGTVMLTPAMLFHDSDIVNGDKLTFDPNTTEVTSSTMCSVRFSEDGTLMYLTFNCRGETDITIGVKDRTEDVARFTFKIKNIDRPEPSFWNKIMISYETYPIIYWIAGIALLVIIFIIILIVLLLKRRKRKREELEAILISEMELEEQMMRLSGGIGSPQYQSYGYLPPTMNIQNDPGLMLGTGAPTASTNTIGLNPGQDGAPSADNGGVPTDSDM